MRFLATALLTLLPHAALLAQQPPSPRAPTKEECAQLQKDLKEMHRLDQLHRTAVSWGTTDPQELAQLAALDDEAHMAEAKRRWREGVRLPKQVADELMAKQAILDKANFERLIGWVRTFGFPDPERLGIEGRSPVTILIHATNAQFEQVAELLRAEAKAGRMDAREFAALSDRKAQHAGGVQLYGMCQRFDAKSNQILPPEIVDIEVTNRARAELGLPPLREYLILKTKPPKDSQPAAKQSVR